MVIITESDHLKGKEGFCIFLVFYLVIGKILYMMPNIVPLTNPLRFDPLFLGSTNMLKKIFSYTQYLKVNHASMMV